MADHDFYDDVIDGVYTDNAATTFDDSYEYSNKYFDQDIDETIEAKEKQQEDMQRIFDSFFPKDDATPDKEPDPPSFSSQKEKDAKAEDEVNFPTAKKTNKIKDVDKTGQKGEPEKSKGFFNKIKNAFRKVKEFFINAAVAITTPSLLEYRLAGGKELVNKIYDAEISDQARKAAQEKQALIDENSKLKQQIKEKTKEAPEKAKEQEPKTKTPTPEEKTSNTEPDVSAEKNLKTLKAALIATSENGKSNKKDYNFVKRHVNQNLTYIQKQTEKIAKLKEESSKIDPKDLQALEAKRDEIKKISDDIDANITALIDVVSKNSFILKKNDTILDDANKIQACQQTAHSALDTVEKVVTTRQQAQKNEQTRTMEEEPEKEAKTELPLEKIKIEPRDDTQTIVLACTLFKTENRDNAMAKDTLQEAYDDIQKKQKELVQMIDKQGNKDGPSPDEIQAKKEEIDEVVQRCEYSLEDMAFQATGEITALAAHIDNVLTETDVIYTKAQLAYQNEEIEVEVSSSEQDGSSEQGRTLRQKVQDMDNESKENNAVDVIAEELSGQDGLDIDPSQDIDTDNGFEIDM